MHGGGVVLFFRREPVTRYLLKVHVGDLLVDESQVVNTLYLHNGGGVPSNLGPPQTPK